MDLHRLTLRAIGPYADEYTIDFAAFHASGVFLLEGPTGSGKSSIIDALVFALYGGLAGSSSSDDRLRSHHAAPDVEPFVELVFETGAGIHRIRRTPKWHRPKTRGTGTTPVNMSVTLQRLASPDAMAGETISTRAQEVGSEIPRILGLTKEQFLQTIVLPQGEFARFLAASGEERRLVLQSLFGTELYDRTTAALVERRRAANAAVEGAQRGVDEALAALRGVAADDDAADDDAADGDAADGDAEVARDKDAGEGEPALDVAGADAAVDRIRVRAKTAVGRRAVARAALAAATATHDAAARIAAAMSTRADLLRRRSALGDEAQAAEAARTALVRAGAAALVHAPSRALAATSDEARRATEALDALRDENQPDPFERSLADVRSARDGLLARAAELGATVRLEAALPGRASAIEARSVALAARRGALDIEEAAVGARAVERETVTADLAAAETLAAGLDSAVRQRDDVLALREAVDRRDLLVAEKEKVDATVAAAASAARAAVDVEATLRRQRIDGIAGELAQGLRPGEACVVCGSTAHPSPATLVAGHPTEVELDEAAEHRSALEARLSAARDSAAAVAARLAVAVEGLSESALDDLAGRLVAAEVDVARAEGGVQRRGTLAERLGAFDAETARREAAITAERLAVVDAEASLRSDESSLTDDLASVAAALDDDVARSVDSVADLVVAIRAEAVDLGEIVDAREAQRQSGAALAQRQAELDAALEASPFATVDEAVSATLSPPAAAELEARVRRHDRETDVVAASLASPEIAALTGDETPDVDAAAEAARLAEADHSQAADRASRLEDRAARSERALDVLQAAIRAASEVADESRAIVRMADVASANGPENLRGVTLGTYVLLRRFDDVVAAANSRLGTMSSGRYQLEATERETGNRARRAGLALTIRDNATGTTRDPKSFSGGETFYASLSLALGLADVVRAEAGGIELGTLFVDEGFGTLDPETLDTVMAELGALSAGGRVVGIVSHVEELKQRVADRIEVRRRPDGSSTLRSTVG